MDNIDFHVHVTPPEIIDNWEKYAEKEPYFSMLFHHNAALKETDKFATADDVVAELERKGSFFDKAVVFGFAFTDIGLCRYVNDYVMESIKKYPQRLIGFCVVPPCDEAAKEIERCHSEGFMGVGELFPAGQQMNMVEKKETSSITETCKELGIPLLLHVNELVGHQYVGKTDVSLDQIEIFVRNNPDLKIVLAHWGGGLMFYETMKEIYHTFKNVYYDTAATPFLYDKRIYLAAKALGLCEKILFGSDFPLLPWSRYLDGIDQSGLSAEDQRLIMGGNAKRLLHL